MPGARWPASGARNELRLRTARWTPVLVTLRRAGAVTNVSIQIRYCTATTADKPFGEMENLIGWPGFGFLTQPEKARQT
jgi:hypothetical protein